MSSILGVALKGIKAVPVEVETEITGGLFSITVVGLPDAAVKEARERVRAALRGQEILLKGRITVNLAPADLPKEGVLLDLPMALGMAQASRALPPLKPAIFMGELALDGRLRGVRGVVPAALLAREKKLPLYVPSPNASEASLVKGIRCYAVPDLAALLSHLRNEVLLEPIGEKSLPVTDPFADPDLADIKGHLSAKRALEIAAAGHHNFLLVGSPGSGKTLLARALRGILPALSDEELLEVLLVRSTAGLPLQEDRTRPFRVVHPTASTVAICGGGNALRPGEITLAHRGVLFLDEFPEFHRDVLESLRQPLEDGRIVVSRASGSVDYPARVLLACACNPCACGFWGDPVEPCRCSRQALENYRRKLSGPLLDRIDLHVSVPRLSPQELVMLEGHCGETSAVVRRRVQAARDLQQDRWKKVGFQCNAELPERILRKNLQLSPSVRPFLAHAAEKTRLSGRGVSRVLRIARTIADLEPSPLVEVHHVAEALAYREGEGMAWMRA